MTISSVHKVKRLFITISPFMIQMIETAVERHFTESEAKRRLWLIYFIILIMVRSFPLRSAKLFQPPGGVLTIPVIVAYIHQVRHLKAGRASDNNAWDR